MDSQLRRWRDDQKHLPDFMRDFHNCKDLFKAISEYIVCEEGHPAEQVNLVQAHCYTLDVFLWFMAEHGYTLQRSRARHEFTDLHERIQQMKDSRCASLASLLQQEPSHETK